jgi:hypothetical protein
MKKTQVKRLYKGFASIRSYIVQKCIDKKESLLIIYGKEKMSISWENLYKYVQLNKQVYGSIYNNIKYTLCDYFWRPDKEE